MLVLNERSRRCPTCGRLIHRGHQIATGPVRHLACAPGELLARVGRAHRAGATTATAIADRLGLSYSVAKAALRELVG